MNRTITGCFRFILGLAIPLVALASGILFFANQIVIHHETHRRGRGVRFAEDAQALTTQLDEMMNYFEIINEDMTKALKHAYAQAKLMAENNEEMKRHAPLMEPVFLLA